MKDKIISLIILLGIDCNEILLDIRLRDDLIFNSIEWRRSINQLILHKFIDDDDYEYNFDELPNIMKNMVYIELLKIYESS
jgi:hypothetical protein